MENLRWDVTMVDGEVVPKENLHFIKVSPARGQGTHYADESLLLRWFDYEALQSVTREKLGGLKVGEHA